MKIILIASVLLIAMFASFAVAQEAILGVGDAVAIPDTNPATDTTTIPATLTDSSTTTTSAPTESAEKEPVFGVWGLRMRALLATDSEKKAEIELKIAEWYSRKAEQAAKNGNVEAASKNLDKYNKMMEKIQARVQKMDGAKNEAGIKKSAEKLVGLERAIEVHQQRIDAFKQKLASGNLTPEQKTRLEEKLAKMETNTQKLTDLQAKKKEELKTKLMAIGDKTKEEADTIVEEAGKKVAEKQAKERKKPNNK